MTLTIGPDVRGRYLRSVLNNLAEYGFTYRSITHDGGTEHGWTVADTAEYMLDLELANITLANVNNRERKVGLFIVNEANMAPMDMIADFGAANEEDMAVVQRCIDGGTSA